ncbi:Gldg family protein [Pontibacter sp. G13]|uniref:GldG family protein n=1 Tax=Pontibacter sp. G13 TaxID=3074898 RepID=UPI00288C3574|nr:Gldg family protein [Pontibacter sp. G13]WNJ21076.1 Gldg family protein [Pontibacter sp. G13]
MNNKQKTIQWLLVIGVIIVVNLLTSGIFKRFDLTKEGRYSLSEVTEETLDTLKYPVVMTVFLEGKFPPNIREYQSSIQTTLLEMKQYAGYKLEFEFVDPSNNPQLLKTFQDKGFVPIPIKVQVSATEQRQQYMWPLVVAQSRGRELYIDLLKGASVMTPQGPNVNFIKAESDLEYKLISAIRTLVKDPGESGLIAFLQGHGETNVGEMGEWVNEMQNGGYQVYTLSLGQTERYEISPSIKLLIISQPTQSFSERDKYEIDQYLMRGGAVLWLMGQEKVDLDMYKKQSALTELRELNLDDLFMRYGFKINYDLVQDLNCEKTEVFVEGPNGGSFTSRPWVFSPLIFNFPDHPINKNVDAALLRYASSIDTVSVQNVRREVFLQTSPASRTIQGAQFINVGEYVSTPPPASMFRGGPKMVGVYAEGQFQSVFANRAIPNDVPSAPPAAARQIPHNHPDVPGRMAIISDGEFALGKQFRGERGYMPYDNKTLLSNAVDYLQGDLALTLVRSKEVTVRQIDREKAAESAGLIRVINIVLPVLIIILFGVIRAILRRRKQQGYQEI